MKPIEQIQLAIIVSEFNQPVTSKLLEGALSEAEAHGLTDAQIKVVKVPGAVEIPLVAQVLAKKNQYDAIIAFGAVIRGETSHYDYVCDQASQGCQRVMLDHELPVIFGVLTCENLEQAFDRLGGKRGHVGKSSLVSALDMINVMSAIK